MPASPQRQTYPSFYSYLRLLTQRLVACRYIAMVLLGCICLAFLSVASCSKDILQEQLALLAVTPSPTSQTSVQSTGQPQHSLDNPVGISMGRVPLFSNGEALFLIENIGQANAKIFSLEQTLTEGAQITYRFLVDGISANLPLLIRPQEAIELVVIVAPTADTEPFTIDLALHTNTGSSKAEVLPLRITGEGWFIGTPNLTYTYQGITYTIPDDCTILNNHCTLPPFDFGTIALGATAAAPLRLSNTPLPNTCQLPITPEGTSCAPVCIATIAPGNDNIGFGLASNAANTAFSFPFQIEFPIAIGSSEYPPACAPLEMIYPSPTDLIIEVAAGTTETSHRDTLIIESNSPSGARVEIPLIAAARQPPIAIATLKTCTEGQSTLNCVSLDTSNLQPMLRPLARVYLDGSASYDPAAPNDPSLISSYQWQVVEAPLGADPSTFDLQPQGAQFNMFLPLAGDYVIQLTVTNTTGVSSLPNGQNSVSFTATPTEKLHVQLVWDNPVNDQDLHMVYADQSPLVYHPNFDCFWKQCKPNCADDSRCTPAQFFQDSAPFTGPNPRLDIDDTNGLGPENINIDTPLDGRYHLFVHYYGLQDPSNNIPTRTTLRIWVNGLLAATYQRTLEVNELWAVAQIDWRDTDATITPAQSDTTEIGTVRSVPFLPYPAGYDFGPIFQ